MKVLLLLLLFLTTTPATASTKRFGVVLGNNLGHQADRQLHHAEADARKMHRVLVELGGFEPANLTLLLGADADRARSAFEAVKKNVSRAASKHKTMLLIYYSGHADGDVLELGSSSLPFKELTTFLASAQGDVRLAFIDSCKSGSLVLSKGGKRGPAFEIDLADEITSTGYAVVTSSADDELSQESAEIRGSYFTHYLISALRGAGDESGDGRVTLSEAYRYAYSRTVARTSATIAGSQHPMYDFKLAGRGGIVLTNTLDLASQLAFSSMRAGRLVVLDQTGDQMIAEREVPAGHTIKIALAPGAYQVFFLADGTVRAGLAEVVSGSATEVHPETLETRTLSRSVAKGGLFADIWRHRIGALFQIRTAALEGRDIAVGAAVQYRANPESGWQPTAKLTYSYAAWSAAARGYYDLGGFLGGGYVFPAGVTHLRAELLVGYEHLFQPVNEGDDLHSSAGAYHAVFGLEVPIGDFLAQVEGGVGGRLFQVQEEDGTSNLVHRFDLFVAVGGGWWWEQ